jgi:RNA polymerase sigma factor (sigma-70 family)
MSDRLNAEAVYLEHRDTIERAAVKAARKFGLRGGDADEFPAWAGMKLMEDDYAVFHKFRGESDWRTYLTTVVTHLASAYSRQRRGRWRPSAAAVRHGPPAPQLERMVRRDGYSLGLAGETLRTAGETTLTDTELARLLATFPERDPLRPVEVASEPVLEAAQGTLRADVFVAASETDAERGVLAAAVARVMERLQPEDRAIVQLHFAEGHRIADVARLLGVDQKPLYRRIPKLREALRLQLEREGVSAGQVLEAIEGGES